MKRDEPQIFSSSERKKRVISIIAILLAGFVGLLLLLFLQSTPPRQKPKRVAAPVTVMSVKQSTVLTTARGFGTVAAHGKLEIRPEVSGSIVVLSDAFQQGLHVRKGDLLFQIDPRNYEAALQEAKAQLAQASLELQLEQGNQIVAKKEWELLEKGIKLPLGKDLALRHPHLREKQAKVSAARSLVKKARVDLERTKVQAPFNGVVLEESVEKGKYVSPQEIVVTIANTDQFEVEVNLPVSELQWLPTLLHGKRDSVVIATIKQRVDDGLQYERKGLAIRLLSDVDPKGRMARVLVLVDKPLRVRSKSDIPLLLGSYVSVQVQGKRLGHVYPIPEKAIREGGSIWIVTEDDSLKIVPVKILYSTAQTVYVRGEIPDEIQLITNALPGALNDMPVAIQEGPIR